MLGQRTSRLDADRAGDEGRRRPERVRGASSRPRRHLPGVECLEDRRLLSAITVFPIPKGSSSTNSVLTAGPDGNLWFGEYTSSGPAIARITPAGVLTAFPLPAGDVTFLSNAVTVGPDGNLWFTLGFVEDAVSRTEIARITPAGALAEFPLPAGGPPPTSLAVGPDGNLWFADQSGAEIGRITPAGALTEFPLPAGIGPSSLTVGPDGNLWFSDPFEGTIGRITPAGALTEFPVPAGADDDLSDAVTVGPDGNLWFALWPIVNAVAYPEIARITTSGAITEFPLQAGDLPPQFLTVGPDDNLWFAEGTTAGAQIGRITPSGTLAEFPLPAGYGLPNGLTAGPDGNLWFSEELSGAKYLRGAIARITPAGALTKFSLPARYGLPNGLTAGPDGNLWFPYGAGRIGRIDPTTPRVTGVVAVAHSGGAITSILLRFDGALHPASARNGRSFVLAAGVASGPTIVYSKGVKIARVSYDRAASTVKLKLAKPQEGPVQVTVRAGLVAADGMSSTSDFTAVVK